MEMTTCSTLRSYYEFLCFHASIGSVSLSVSFLVHFSVWDKTLQPHNRISIKSCALAVVHVNNLPSFVSCIQIHSLPLPMELRLSGFQWFGWHFIEWIWPLKGGKEKQHWTTPALICSRSIDASDSHGSKHNGPADKQPILIQHAMSAGEFRVLEKATGGYF